MAVTKKLVILILDTVLGTFMVSNLKPLVDPYDVKYKISEREIRYNLTPRLSPLYFTVCSMARLNSTVSMRLGLDGA